jgi:hypothetical protein
VRLERADAVPIGFLHPALIGPGILCAVVDDRASAQDFHSVHFPEIQASVEVGAGSEIVGVAALRVEALVIHTGRIEVHLSISGRWWGWRTGEDEQHCRVIQKVARARDGELLRAIDFEADCLPVARGANAEPPRLNVYAPIPKAGLTCSDGDRHGSGDVKIDEVVAGGRMCHIDRLIVHGDAEGAGAQLGWYRHRLNMRSGIRRARKRKQCHEECTKATQEAETLT